MGDRFSELRGYGCEITADAEATARAICAEVKTPLGIFGGSAWDEDDEPDGGLHVAMFTSDAYVAVCIDADGKSMLSRCSSDTASFEGCPSDVAAAIKFFHDHEIPNNHPELGASKVTDLT